MAVRSSFFAGPAALCRGSLKGFGFKELQRVRSLVLEALGVQVQRFSWPCDRSFYSRQDWTCSDARAKTHVYQYKKDGSFATCSQNNRSASTKL